MLINCVAYEQGKKLADIPVDDISDHLAQPGHFVWVALKDPTQDELQVMQDEFGIHELVIEDVLHGNQRPKIERYGANLFAVMHLLEPLGDDDEADPDARVGEVLVFAGPNYVLSVRARSAADFLGVRRRAESEPNLLSHGAGFVLYALMDAVVDRYFPVIDALEVELEQIEAEIFADTSARSTVERLYRLKQKLIVLRRAVAPLLEAMGELQGPRVPAFAAGMQEYLRDVADHLARINNTIDTTRDTINTAIQVSLSITGIEENKVSKRLASWAAIFGVWTALAGVWGMNFEHMPELKLRFGYALALSSMAAACAFLYWRFRRAGWL